VTHATKNKGAEGEDLHQAQDLDQDQLIEETLLVKDQEEEKPELKEARIQEMVKHTKEETRIMITIGIDRIDPPTIYYSYLLIVFFH
jgi:hypothetical protein